jgi:hypothetical protein
MNEIENTHPSTQRDYDKDPVEIKDDSRQLSLWLYIVFAILIYSYVLLNPNSHFTQINLMISISIFVLPVLYKSLPLLHEESIITLSNTQIIRQWGESTNALRWSSNVIIEKSFIDFFDKQQADASWQKYFGFLFNILFLHPLLIFTKIIYHLVKNGLNAYRFFDTFVFHDGDVMVAILITNNQDYELLKEFLSIKGVDIDQISVFYTPFYLSLESVTKDR